MTLWIMLTKEKIKKSELLVLKMELFLVLG